MRDCKIARRIVQIAQHRHDQVFVMYKSDSSPCVQGPCTYRYFHFPFLMESERKMNNHFSFSMKNEKIDVHFPFSIFH